MIINEINKTSLVVCLAGKGRCLDAYRRDVSKSFRLCLIVNFFGKTPPTYVADSERLIPIPETPKPLSLYSHKLTTPSKNPFTQD